MNKNLCFGILLALAGAIAMPLDAGEKPEHSWENLRQLHAGDRIEVVRMNFKTVRGEFTGISDEAISLRVASQEVGVAREDVLRVASQARNHRLRNAWIGAAIGAGVGLTVDRTLGAFYRNEGGEFNAAAAYMLPIAAGGGLGAAVASHPTVYRAAKIAQPRGAAGQ